MSDREEKMRQRQYVQPGARELSAQEYNMVLGGTLLYGFLVNCFMVKFCYGAISDLFANPIAFYLLYFVMVIVGTIMVNGSSSPVVSFIGYNLIVIPLGLVLSVVLNAFNLAGYQNTVTMAFAITGLVTAAMMIASAIVPDFFLSLGKTLCYSLIITIVIELILTLTGNGLGIIDYIVVLIFCGYIGYDWARANTCAKTADNAVDFAAELYVDIVNLFLRILRILARSSNN